MAFWLPLAMMAGGTALGEWQRNRQKSKVGQVDIPEMDMGAMRSALYSGIGGQQASAGRSAQAQMASQGLNDSGLSYSLGRGIAGEGMRAFQQGLGGLQNMQNQYNLQRAGLQLQQAGAQDAYNQNQPGIFDSMSLGANMAGLYPLINPEPFTPQFNNVSQNVQGGSQLPQIPQMQPSGGFNLPTGGGQQLGMQPSGWNQGGFGNQIRGGLRGYGGGARGYSPRTGWGY